MVISRKKESCDSDGIFITSIEINIKMSKGIAHPKMKMLSSFTHPHVIPNLYKFLSYVEHKRRYFEEF